ncbi:Uncharacterized protein dnm_019620 [Desulfonema magnum]|uniref:Uncharacterized protein n=1 Tax=Desulfonema magnum TaxID=45655 RepID=A0A975BIX3_9BACT|nr:Uncharacterized protein dnm_019620 [Desulfonema magnum]
MVGQQSCKGSDESRSVTEYQDTESHSSVLVQGRPKCF